MSDIVLKYRDTIVDPPPILKSLSHEVVKTQAGEVIGCKNMYTFEGFYIADTGQTSDLIAQIAVYQELFSCTGELLITCDTVPIFSQCVFPTNFQVDESTNNLVQSFPYTLTLEGMNTGSCCSPALTAKSDTWTIEADTQCYYNDTNGDCCVPLRRFIVTHNASASAMDSCNGSKGWEIARDEVDNLLDVDFSDISNSILGNGCLDGTKQFNFLRKIDIDKTGGTYSASDSFMLVEQNTGDYDNVFDSCTVEISRDRSSRIYKVNINGTIEGYESRTYNAAELDPGFDPDQPGCYYITESKYDAALTYFNFLTGELHTRAQNISGLTLSAKPMSSTVTYSPCGGTIGYNYTFDNRTRCFDTGGPCEILDETVTISNNYPSDVYAEFNVIGRPCPILQELGIRSKGTKTVDINLIVDCGDMCTGDTIDILLNPDIKSQADDIIQQVYTQLTGTYSTVYIDNSSDSWDPKTGSYQRSITYAFSECCSGV